METREYSSVIRYGKGKNSVVVFGIKGYETKAGKIYCLVHVPTHTILAEGYYYLSQCRKIGNELVKSRLVSNAGTPLLSISLEEVRAAFSREMVEYLLFYRYSDTKEPLSYEDFINGPDYENLLNRERDSIDAERLRAEHARELSEGDITLAWVPKDSGTIRGDDLECLIEGRRTYSERFYPKASQ